jgi:SEC-C motif-containing protein
MNDDSVCPCGAGLPYRECCAPFHRGQAEPVSAEVLMRSRFAAFARGEVEWIWTSLHPDHDDRAESRETVLAHLRDGLARGVVYGSLVVLDTRPPDAEGVARVLFWARVKTRDKDASFVELSSFAHDGEGWRYLFGVPVATGPKAKGRLRGDPRRLTIGDVERREG